ncbi:NADH:ubiquinone oxidoreductase [Podila humilis]|nr:NADH:ubiquinone oxidoreductase [Podila humilis]
MSTEHPSFQSVSEELEYFKQHSKNLEEDLSETKYALEEFQLSSKELEEELEKEIDSTERRYIEIKIRNEAMRQEAEEWKEKYHQALKDSNININQLTRQLDQLKLQTEMFIKKERELEQDNDDLERTERAAKWSLQELERKYNVALEKTAMLEGEVTSKTAMAEEVQRLKDELRDTNVELAVMKSNQAAAAASAAAAAAAAAVANTSTASLSSYAGSTSSLSGGNKSAYIGNHEAMPSIRARLAKNNAGRPATTTRTAGANGTTTPHQNPVKMVQEMVGRVKSLEARLVSCRSLVTPLLQPPPSYSTSIPPTSGRTTQRASSTSPTGSRSGSRPGSPNYNSLSSPKVGRRTSLLQKQQQQRMAGSGMITS